MTVINGVASNESCMTHTWASTTSEDKSTGTNLALIEDVDRGSATTEDFGVILVDGSLGISNRRHILDHHDMIRVLALADLDSLGTHIGRFVQQPIGVNYIIDDAALAALLALELRFCRQIATVVVAEMVGCRAQWTAA